MQSRAQPKVIFALIAAQCLFGIHYQVSKFILSQFSPFLWASARGLATAALFFIVSLSLGKLNPQRAFRDFGPLCLFALLSTCLNQLLFLGGLQFTSTVNSALLNTLIPVVTLVIVTLTGREHPSRRQVIGSTLAFFGVLVLLNVEHFRSQGSTLIGDGLILLNVLSYSIFLTYSRPFLQKHHNLWSTTWMFIVGSAMLTTAAAPEWLGFSPPEASWQLIGAMGFAVLGGTFAAYLLVNYALSQVPASQVAIFVYIQPVVASLIGWGMFGETPTVRTLVAALLVFSGVALAVGKVGRLRKRHGVGRTRTKEPPRRAA